MTREDAFHALLHALVRAVLDDLLHEILGHRGDGERRAETDARRVFLVDNFPAYATHGQLELRARGERDGLFLHVVRVRFLSSKTKTKKKIVSFKTSARVFCALPHRLFHTAAASIFFSRVGSMRAFKSCL